MANVSDRILFKLGLDSFCASLSILNITINAYTNFYFLFAEFRLSLSNCQLSKT